MFRRCLCQMLFVIPGKSAAVFSTFAASIAEENETDIHPFIKCCVIKKKLYHILSYQFLNEERMY